MKRVERLYHLKRIAQELEQKSNLPNIRPMAPNLSGYWEKLTTIIPGLNINKIDNKSWVALSKIIGILDWSLVELSNNKINFYSTTTQTPSVTSANAENAAILTALIKLCQMIKAQCVEQGEKLSETEILEFINKISLGSTAIATNTSNKELTAIIQGGPKDSIAREISSWKNILNTP